MTRIIFILISVFVVLIGGLLIGPSFVDWNQHKPTLSQKIQEFTGYQVDIAGDIKLALLPTPVAKVSGLTVISNPDAKQPLLKLDRANVQVALVPLLSQKVEIKDITLVNPVIYVEKQQDGRFSYMTDTLAEKTAQTDSGKPSAQTTDGASAVDFSFDSIRIENGALTYHDLATGQTHAIQNLSAKLQAATLQGPYRAEGQVDYQDTTYAFKAETKDKPDETGTFPIILSVGIPAASTTLQFSGIIDPKGQEVQGQTKLETSSLEKLAQHFNATINPAAGKQSFAVSGNLKAGTSQVSMYEMSVKLGDFQATGAADIANIDSKDPLQFSVNLASDQVFDLGPFMGAGNAGNNQAGNTAVTNEGAAAELNNILPQTITLPMAVQGKAELQFAGLKANDNLIQGMTILADIDGKVIRAETKILEAPGKANMDGEATLAFGSRSVSKTGAVTLADPGLSFSVKGNIPRIHETAQAFDIALAPAAQSINSVRFNIKGRVPNDRIAFDQSAVIIDNSTIGLKGFYKPNPGGRDQINFDVSADTIDLDKFVSTSGSKPAQSNAQNPSGTQNNPAAALQNFMLPFDANFDVSVQDLQFQGKQYKGVRAIGALNAKTLTLTQAGINNIANSAFSAKGSIGNIQTLSGIDLDLTAKSQDLPALLSAFGQDASALPKGLKSFDSTINAEGSVESLKFGALLKAMNGSLSANGTAANILQTPQLSNMALGIKHPNFVQAMQIINPSFTAGQGLQQAIDISAKVDQSGKTYTLNSIKGSFGPTSLDGTIKANMAGAKPSIEGELAMGSIPLDTFLGSTQAQKARTNKGSGSNVASSGERWSTRPLDVSWMNSANVNLALSATKIDYGGWSFTNPKGGMSMAENGLTIQDLTAGLFGGNAKVNATLSPLQAGGVALNANSSMDNVALGQLIYALSNSNKLQAQGSGSLTMDLKSSGKSANALVNALSGSAALNGRNITMQGFDLGNLARALSDDLKPGDSAQSLLNGVRGGTTQIDTIDGAYNIQNGVVAIQSMTMDGPDALIESSGNASLPKWRIDTVHKISLKNAAEDVPPFEITIAGPLDNPGNTFGRGILQDFVQRKLQRKLAKEAERLLGDKVDGQVGNALKQLGILPQDSTPAAGNDQKVQPQEEAPAQQQQQAPSSPIDQLLNNPGEPEEAIRGVLDGLLR